MSWEESLQLEGELGGVTSTGGSEIDLISERTLQYPERCVHSPIGSALGYMAVCPQRYGNLRGDFLRRAQRIPFFLFLLTPYRIIGVIFIVRLAVLVLALQVISSHSVIKRSPNGVPLESHSGRFTATIEDLAFNERRVKLYVCRDCGPISTFDVAEEHYAHTRATPTIRTC
ncbi:hypothetical protein Btru_077939 [Bulinus truncatus]|nr:hypothetical protein Btru_077939 [Bulinus truncatus]